MVVGGAPHYTHDSHSGQNGIKFSPRLQSFFTITGSSSLGLGCRSCYLLVEVENGGVGEEYEESDSRAEGDPNRGAEPS